jgi:GTPase SAR1 family protein
MMLMVHYSLVYDVTNRDTFDELNNWLQELNLYTNNGNIVKMIVGNKVDKVNRTNEHACIIISQSI